MKKQVFLYMILAALACACADRAGDDHGNLKDYDTNSLVRDENGIITHNRDSIQKDTMLK